MSRWVFAKLDPGAACRDANDAQLFKAEQASEGEYACSDALVREILQNSMDAGRGKKLEALVLVDTLHFRQVINTILPDAMISGVPKLRLAEPG